MPNVVKLSVIILNVAAPTEALPFWVNHSFEWRCKSHPVVSREHLKVHLHKRFHGQISQSGAI